MTNGLFEFNLKLRQSGDGEGNLNYVHFLKVYMFKACYGMSWLGFAWHGWQSHKHTRINSSLWIKCEENEKKKYFNMKRKSTHT